MNQSSIYQIHSESLWSSRFHWVNFVMKFSRCYCDRCFSGHSKYLSLFTKQTRIVHSTDVKRFVLQEFCSFSWLMFTYTLPKIHCDTFIVRKLLQSCLEHITLWNDHIYYSPLRIKVPNGYRLGNLLLVEVASRSYFWDIMPIFRYISYL